MARITFDEVTFDGTLTVNTKPSDLGSGHIDRDMKPVPGSEAQYCVYTKKDEERLWILSAELQFTGAVNATGPAEKIEQWQVGIIQSIYQSERTGVYTGAVKRMMRFDTSFGPLKDGQYGILFYCNSETFVGASSSLHIATVTETDAPNFWSPTVYSGNPKSRQQGISLQKLIGTEGLDRFESYLGVVNYLTKTIIVLGKSTWHVCWEGKYDFEKKSWTSANPQSLNHHHETDFSQVYERLNQNKNTQLPFSILNDEAEEWNQINGNEGWTYCEPDGTPREGHLVDTSRWND